MKNYLLFLISILLLAACSDASLYDPAKATARVEKVSKDKTEITICSSIPTQENHTKIKNLAKKECALYGKQAKFASYSFATCPLSKPNSYKFKCITPLEQLIAN